MSKRIFVQPRKGLVVRDPDHGHAVLPEEGRHVALTDYWRRRLRDGDVIETEAPAAKPAVKASKGSDA